MEWGGERKREREGGKEKGKESAEKGQTKPRWLYSNTSMDLSPVTHSLLHIGQIINVSQRLLCKMMHSQLGAVG